MKSFNDAIKGNTILPLIALLFVLSSCGTKSTTEEQVSTYPLEFENFAYADSTKFADVSIKGILPVAKDSVSQVIRDTLLAMFGRSMNLSDIENVGETDLTTSIAPYSGDTKDAKGAIDYYGKAAMKTVNKRALEDYNEQKQEEAADTTTDDNSGSPMPSVDESFRPWEFDVDITKIFEDSTYVVFNNEIFTGYGGAHPNIINETYTFRFSDGSHVTEWFKEGVTNAMQPLLKKGLKQYFKEGEQPIANDSDLFDNLQLAGGSNIIPLPVYPPCPTAKGLTFTYQTDEIACHAAGMPSFTLTWEELKPFLK